MEGATLAKYYRNDLYPLELIYRMMTCDKKGQSAEARIIGVQYQGDSGVYVMRDYKRDSCQSLRQKILFSSSQVPASLHMALFREGGDNKFIRAEKELVFDIDITDFTRFCACRGVKRLCPACWFHLQGSSLILQHMLENMLGYEERHCLWVFSGRRGLHCLVNAPTVMNLSDRERGQLYKRLSITMGDDTRLVSFIRSIAQTDPAFLTRVQEFFIQYALREQDLFALPVVEGDSFESFCLEHLRLRHNSLYHFVKNAWEELSLSPSPSKKPRLAETESLNVSLRKWKILQALENGSTASSYRASVFIMFRLMYPVIDKGPFMLSHQIKLPFSVHSLTHNIALPLKQTDIMRMDITKDTLSITDVCKHKTPPPPFKEGLRLFERWIESYNNNVEFIEIDETQAH